MNEKRLFRVTLKLHAKRLLFMHFWRCIAATLLCSSIILLSNLLGQRFLPDIRILETTMDLSPYLPQVLIYYGVLIGALLLSAPLQMAYYAWLSELSMNRRTKLKVLFVWLGDIRLAMKAYGAILRFALHCLLQAVIHLALPVAVLYFVSQKAAVMGVQGAVYLVGLLTLLLIAGLALTIYRAMSVLPALFLLASHPHLRVREAFSESRRFMAERNGEFFWLIVSFIGWFYLMAMTGGILSLFILPYFSLSVLLFTQEARARWNRQMGRHTPDPVWTPSTMEEREEPYV